MTIEEFRRRLTKARACLRSGYPVTGGKAFCTAESDTAFYEAYHKAVRDFNQADAVAVLVDKVVVKLYSGKSASDCAPELAKLTTLLGGTPRA